MGVFPEMYGKLLFFTTGGSAETEISEEISLLSKFHDRISKIFMIEFRKIELTKPNNETII